MDRANDDTILTAVRKEKQHLVNQEESSDESEDSDDEEENWYPESSLNGTHPKLVTAVQQALSDMGVRNPAIKTAKWQSRKYHAISIFQEACQEKNLTIKWGDKQITAYIELLKLKHYAGSTLDATWKTFKSVGEWIGKEVTAKQQWLYDQVRAEAKEYQDNKLLVSLKLLVQLYNAADLFLVGYNRYLAKAVFLCVWNFAMRISEYSEMAVSLKQPKRSHNIRTHCVRVSHIGLSIAFESDKTSNYSKTVKHRTTKWSKLPHFTRSVLEKFMELRPKGAENFFCKRDGRPLTRPDVLNFLRLCLLGTEWRNLKIEPHSF